MGVDAGFDMVPCLSKGVVDRQNWDTFIEIIKDHYRGDQQVEVKPNYILFKAGEHPKLPFEGHKLLRFSSKVSGSHAKATRVENYLDKVTQIAQLHFGSRVRYWDECRDQRGHYGWQEVHESIRSYEQRDEPESYSSIAHFVNGSDPIKDLGIQLYQVANVSGKGRGLIARFNITKGTRILKEKPLLLVRPLPPKELESDMAAGLKLLTKTEQRQFLSLHNNFPGRHPFGGIAKTNALPCGSGSPVGAVYATTCLINHSCLPNSHNSWNDATKQETIHATRNIAAGEEITISYDRGGPQASRKAFLREAFGFDCCCAVCSLPPLELQRSDARRMRIQEYDAAIGDPLRMANRPRESLRDCQSLMQLLNEEHAACAGVLLARLYYDAFQICIAHGDQARASVFADRAYKVRITCEGEDSPETRRMKSLELQPDRHGSFGLCSTRWRTTRDMIPLGLDTAQFEAWLWKEYN